MFNDSSLAVAKGKKQGIKIVSNPYSKRESDPFNTKNFIKDTAPSISHEEKRKLVEQNQNYVDSQIKVTKKTIIFLYEKDHISLVFSSL